MAGLKKAMENKGYIPISSNQYGGIGFVHKLGRMEYALEKPIWFDIGYKIKDKDGNELPVTIAAYNSVQYEEYLKKGWKVVEAVTVDNDREKEKKKEKKEKKK